MSILKTKIDYTLFEKYDKEYFIENKIVPIYEDSISLKISICTNSNIEKIKDNFIKIINFIEEKESDILFILAHIEKRVNLHKSALKSISSNDDEKFTSYFLDELILYSIEQRASDIHIEKYQDLCLFKFRVDGRLRIFFSFDEELFRVFSSFVKLISNSYFYMLF